MELVEATGSDTIAINQWKFSAGRRGYSSVQVDEAIKELGQQHLIRQSIVSGHVIVNGVRHGGASKPRNESDEEGIHLETRNVEPPNGRRPRRIVWDAGRKPSMQQQVARQQEERRRRTRETIQYQQMQNRLQFNNTTDKTLIMSTRGRADFVTSGVVIPYGHHANGQKTK